MKSVDELSASTGIERNRLLKLIHGVVEPSGDEILILADFFKIDYRFFISNEKVAPIEETEVLFRKHGNKLTKEDRMAIQEVLFMAECEHFLQLELGRFEQKEEFKYSPKGIYFKGHAEDAAKQLRRHLGYADNEVSSNVFEDFRSIGFHVFRRKLSNAGISGISVRHPTAGKCILVNYHEDIYRQRFTLVHEAAHCLFDLEDNEGVYVSYNYKNTVDLREIRADSFASHFLLPREFIKKLPVQKWDNRTFLHYCNKLRVNPEPLSIALYETGLISRQQQEHFKSLMSIADLN